MRRILYFLTLIILFSLFTASVSGTDILAFSSPGYTGEEKNVFTPDGDDVMHVGIPGSGWDFSGDVDWSRRRITNGISYLTAYLFSDEDFNEPDNEEIGKFNGSTALSLDYTGDEVDLSLCSTLYFGLSLDADDGTVYPVYVVITADGQEFSAELSVTCSSSERTWQLLSFDIREINGMLEKIVVHIDYSRGAVPAAVKCSAPYARTRSNTAFLNADRFATDRFISSVGSVTPSSGKVRPDEEDNRAEISGNLLTLSQPLHGTDAYFIVTLSGVQSGDLSLGVTYAGSSAGTFTEIFLSDSLINEHRYYTPKVALSASDHIYIFPIEVYDDIVSYTLLFNNIECDVYFTIESVALIGTQNPPAPGNTDIGTVSSIQLTGNNLTFSGSMERDAVKEGGFIYFYALPASSPDDPGKALSLGSTKVSTLFTHTVELSSTPNLGDTYLFFAAVHKKGENGSTSVRLLSKPRYIDASVPGDTGVSNAGLYGAASVGVFESNVSHVLVDVPLDELLISSGGTSFSYFNYDAAGDSRAAQIHLSHDFLLQLDRDINFYVSAGIRVYLRIYSSSPIDGLTYDGKAESYLPDLSVSGARHKYAAIVRFLSRRYSGTAGYVLGHGVNCGDYTGNAFFTDVSNNTLAEYTASLAELCRVTYNAARFADNSDKDILVIVPFAPDRGENNWCSPRILSVMLSERLDDIGPIPWAIQTALYEDPSDFSAGYSEDDALADDFAALTSMQRMFDELKLSAPTTFTFFYQPDNDALLLDYGEYVEAVRALGKEIPEYSRYAADRFAQIYHACASYRARAVFISLDGLSLKNDHAFYSDLKSVGSVSDTDSRYVYDSRASVDQAISGNTYVMFDFSDEYYTLGWIGGGGVKSCLTEAGERFSTEDDAYVRVLRSSFAEDMGAVDNTGQATSGVAGIVLRNLSREYDFSAIDQMEFVLSLEHAQDKADQSSAFDDATVVLVIGTDDHRAEYYASGLSIGGIQTLSCDLTGYEYRSAVDYIGIMVYANEEVVLDLSRVSVGSDTLDENALSAMFSRSGDDTSSSDWVTAGLFFILVAAVSVIAMIILIRRDREEEEQREAALQLQARHRRRHT